MTTDEIIRAALNAPGCERLKEWAAIGSVQRAAFEEAVEVIAAAKEAQMIQEGWRKCAVGQRATQFCPQVEKAVAAERARGQA